jgi:hypothetical protein
MSQGRRAVQAHAPDARPGHRPAASLAIFYCKTPLLRRAQTKNGDRKKGCPDENEKSLFIRRASLDGKPRRVFSFFIGQNESPRQKITRLGLQQYCRCSMQAGSKKARGAVEPSRSTRKNMQTQLTWSCELESHSLNWTGKGARLEARDHICMHCDRTRRSMCAVQHSRQRGCLAV